MKAKKVSKTGYECPSCSEIHTEKAEPINVWWVEEVDAANHLTADEPEKMDGFKLECGALVAEEPEYWRAYECGECETKYLDKDEAKECCK